MSDYRATFTEPHGMNADRRYHHQRAEETGGNELHSAPGIEITRAARPPFPTKNKENSADFADQASMDLLGMIIVTSKMLTNRTVDELPTVVQEIQNYQQEVVDIDLEHEEKTLQQFSSLAAIQAYIVTSIQEGAEYVEELEEQDTAAKTVSATVPIGEEKGIIEDALACLEDLQLKLAQRTTRLWEIYQRYRTRNKKAGNVHLNVPPARTPATDRLPPGWRPTDLRSSHNTAPYIDSSDGGEVESEDTGGDDPYDDGPYDNYRHDNYRYDNHRRNDYSEGDFFGGEYSVDEESPVLNRRGNRDLRR